MKIQDKELLENFKRLCKENDKMIKDKNIRQIQPICFLIPKEGKPTAIMMVWENSEEKERMKQALKKAILMQPIKAYVLIFDTKITMLNQKTGEREVSDAIMRSIYTPKAKKQQAVLYKDHKITKKMTFPQKIRNPDEWDLWGEGIDADSKENKAYQRYKKENPEKYGDLA